MKTINLLFSLLIIVSLITFSNCGDTKKDPEPTEAEKTTKLLTAATWKLQSLTIDGVSDDKFFKGLTITFSATGYTTTNGDPIWPASGTWDYSDGPTSARKIKRNDNVEVTIDEITASNLTLSLQWDKTTTGGRTSSIPGKHIFKLTP
jgi:hypothetical protein